MVKKLVNQKLVGSRNSMNVFFRKLLSARTVALCLSLCLISTANAQSAAGLGSENSKPFVFSAIPDQDETQLQKRFDKVARYLQKALDIEVQYIPVKSYTAAISAFRNDQIQLAWFGGLSGVQARRLVPGSIAIAQGEEDQFFKSYIIAHHSTELVKQDKLTDALSGMTFTFGSKGSTSGRLMPEYYIREHFKKSSDDIFKTISYTP
mgnify:CR=1 FL=1